MGALVPCYFSYWYIRTALPIFFTLYRHCGLYHILVQTSQAYIWFDRFPQKMDRLFAVTVCTASWTILGRRWWCIGIEWIAFIALPHWWHDIRFRFSDHSSVGILEKEKGLTPITSVHLCCCTQWPLFWPFKCWNTGKRKRPDIIGNSPSSLLYTVTTKEKSQQLTLLALFGAPSGTRTQDPLIKSQLLYQLLRSHLAQGSSLLGFKPHFRLRRFLEEFRHFRLSGSVPRTACILMSWCLTKKRFRVFLVVFTELLHSCPITRVEVKFRCWHFPDRSHLLFWIAEYLFTNTIYSIPDDACGLTIGF